MLEGICPIAQLFVVTLLCFAALVERIAEVIMALALAGRYQARAEPD